jgi:hypothetical protein
VEGFILPSSRRKLIETVREIQEREDNDVSEMGNEKQKQKEFKTSLTFDSVKLTEGLNIRGYLLEKMEREELARVFAYIRKEASGRMAVSPLESVILV